MKFFNLCLVIATLSISNVYAASITVKAKESVEFGDESVQLSSNKGLISIYAINLVQKDFKKLDKIKKGDCIQIIAKDTNLDSSEGVIAIMEFKDVKKVSCK